MDFNVLLSNPMINIGLIAWLAAQLLKTIIFFVEHKKFDKTRLSGSGGMPSSHSALTCSVVLAALFYHGFDSPTFAMAFILALVVMYDATGVRWAAGLHAKAINNIVDYVGETEHPDREKLKKLIPQLNESLGHRIVEVVCGALLGIATACVYTFIDTGSLYF